MKKAVVILSGGLDSSTCLFIAKSQGYELYALTFDYGQRHKIELECAKNVSNSAQVKEHRFITLPTPSGSALTENILVPEDRNLEEMSSNIPVTYVPARNTLFIAYSLQYAEEIDADAIFIGVTSIDYSGYPDCRPEYIEAWQNLIDLATKKTSNGEKISLETPLLHLYKSEIIEIGTESGLDYSLTHSCYNGQRPPCMKCDSCMLRIKGFKELGMRDPLISMEDWNTLISP
jgi:7-cyano-7-deazaguanine synthase